MTTIIIILWECYLTQSVSGACNTRSISTANSASPPSSSPSLAEIESGSREVGQPSSGDGDRAQVSEPGRGRASWLEIIVEAGDWGGKEGDRHDRRARVKPLAWPQWDGGPRQGRRGGR